MAGAWLVTTALAASALGRSAEHRAPLPHEVATAPVAARTASAITLGGPHDVTVVTQVHEAGESRGWHRHTGIHAVAVLSGTLTLYDRQCHAQFVVPGRPYVGGQELHGTERDEFARGDGGHLPEYRRFRELDPPCRFPLPQ